MKTPGWLIPGLVGAAVGVVGFAAVGFAFAGWTTPRQADKMAQAMAADRVMVMMVPVCVERARTDSGSEIHLAAIGKATGTGRRDALMATGWATLPGSSSPDRALADACLTALDLPGR